MCAIRPRNSVPVSTGVAPGGQETIRQKYSLPSLASATDTEGREAETCGTVTVALGDSRTNRAALVALYNATDGESWASNSNWLSETPIGEWNGVRTIARDSVSSLELESNQLTGCMLAGFKDMPDKYVFKLGLSLC